MGIIPGCAVARCVIRHQIIQYQMEAGYVDAMQWILSLIDQIEYGSGHQSDLECIQYVVITPFEENLPCGLAR